MIFEDLLIAGGGKAISWLAGKVISGANKGLNVAGETMAASMVTDEMIMLGTAADLEFSALLSTLGNKVSAGLVNSVKAAADAPMKTTVVNGVATGTVATLGEIYDYTTSGDSKQLTKENIYNSAYTVGIEVEKGLLLGGLPLPASTLGSIAIDKVATGNENITKNIGSSIEAEIVGNYLPNTSSGIFVREGIVKFTEEFIKGIKSQEKKDK